MPSNTFKSNDTVYLVNAEQQAKIEKQITDNYKKQLDKRTNAVEAAEEEISRIRHKLNQAAGADNEAQLKKQLEAAKAAKIKAEKKIAKLKQDIQKQAAETAQIFEQNRYKNMGVIERREYQKTVAEKTKIELDAAKDRYQLLEAEEDRLRHNLENATSNTAKQRIQKKLTAVENQKNDAKQDVTTLTDDFNTIQSLVKNLLSGAIESATTLEQATANYTEAEKERDSAHKAAVKAQKAYNKAAKEGVGGAALKALEDAVDATNEQAEAADKAAKAALRHKDALQKEEKETISLEKKQKAFREGLKQDLKQAGKTINNWIGTTVEDIYGNQGRMNARLQGTDKQWRNSVLGVTSTIGYSPVASQTAVIKRMTELVDSGIAYNLELRAFLAEASQNIASTFNALEPSLLRLIRLQQSDSTAARLGMEARLTALLNTMFQDTSYLVHAADAVSQSLLDVSATMSRDNSLAFEYNVQKWLGSLYSLGLSDTAANTIATGLQYIGTGNLSALNSNNALQTLFAMSASRGGGKSYAQLLTDGLTAEDTNDLLRGMVTYLAEIVKNQESQITTSAYADLLGMSVTDLRTFASITTTEINQLYKDTVTYKTLQDEVQDQLNSITKRLSSAQIVDIIMSNVKAGTGATIGSNAATYGLWKALNVVDNVAAIKIPGITVLGSGTTSEIDVINTAKLAFGGLGLLGSMVAAVTAAVKGGAADLSSWNFKETTTRGSTLPFLSRGSSRGTSYSAMMGTGSASAEDISSVSFESTTQSAYDQSGVTSEEMEKAKETPQQILDAIAGDSNVTVLKLLQQIDSRLSPDRVFYTAIAGVLSNPGIGQTVNNLSNYVSGMSAIAASSTGKVSTTNTSNTMSPTSIQSVSGSTVTGSSESSTSLEAVIASAVEQAIRNIAGYSTGNGLPVTITNPNFGGM